MQKHQGGGNVEGDSIWKDINYQSFCRYTFWQIFGETFLLESLISIFELLPGPHSISAAAIQALAHMIQVIGDYSV